MKRKFNVVQKSIYLFAISLVFSTSFAQDVVRQKQFFLKNGVALQGYDAVSYFSGKVQEGKVEFSFTNRGITYHFINAANLETFKKAPERYEPQYGGWCAYAMGKSGEKVEVDPETFKILDGKLYLFYNRFFNNTFTKWNADEAQLKKQADGNWLKTFK